MNAVIWGITAAAAAATVWHAVAEHHVHRRLLRHFRAGTVVPETRHDTWWHSRPRSHRVAAQAALMMTGVAAGIAYETVRLVTMAVLGGLVTAGIVLLIIRTTGTAATRAPADAAVMRSGPDRAAGSPGTAGKPERHS